MENNKSLKQEQEFNSLEHYFEKTKSSIRKEHQLQRLGDSTPVCIVCGYSAPEGLVKADRSLLEDHHLPALHVGPTVSLCRNCHAEQSEKQRDWPKPMFDANRSPLVTLAAFLRGLCEFLISMADHVLLWTTWLLQFDAVIPHHLLETCPPAPITNRQRR